MGGVYEVTTDANNVALSTKKYYSIAGMTVAMNDGSGANGLQYLLTDHLGSVAAVTDANGTLTSQQRYLPFGQVRTDLNGPRITNTDFGYTGQRNLDSLGLMDYHARFYDAALMRWTQPDSITPGGPQGLNRFSYVGENPINDTDPTGHCSRSGDDYCFDHVNFGLCANDLVCGASRETYVRAGINYHGTGWGSRETRIIKNLYPLNKGAYDSIGPAQVSDIEMETPYGTPVIDPATKRIRKVGLGLRSPGSCGFFRCSMMNQDDSSVAEIAMRTRLTLGLDVCMRRGCTANDKFIVAALSIDARIAPSELERAIDHYKSVDPQTVVDWSSFITRDLGNKVFNIGLIHNVESQVLSLLNQGYSAPGVDWNYITGLK